MMEKLDLSWDSLDLVSIVTKAHIFITEPPIFFWHSHIKQIYLYFSGKKARTFDFNAIFEQTRRTAIERSQRALGKFFINNDNMQ